MAHLAEEDDIARLLCPSGGAHHHRGDMADDQDRGIAIWILIGQGRILDHGHDHDRGLLDRDRGLRHEGGKGIDAGIVHRWRGEAGGGEVRATRASLAIVTGVGAEVEGGMGVAGEVGAVRQMLYSLKKDS